ncbi:uncharacterized protein N7483_012160 [Penicillium malachiteum]|uniref:uncharacterized protein n=1 Tax=Penicillium malachiteum TaxID=1324776 RepID=UPI00254894A4|nr:uncharacterized protein N7483_012160 [Penicillium malachiteum]KAJ5714979.1 hypothetical protein N7483_012160 [Penicillium malachiteum]
MADSHKKRRLSQEGSTPENSTKMDITTTEAADVDPSKQPKRTLFVRSLPASATTEKLAEFFSQSYVIKHATVVSDSQTKLSKGYGFVTFADLEDAQSALEELNGADFDGKKIRVDYAEARKREIDEKLGRSVPTAASLKSKQEREGERGQGPAPKLIVRNLPWSIKEPEDLARLFRSFGKVKFVTLPKRGDKLAGFGFVVIRGKKNSEKALECVNGKEVDGRTLAVDWAVEKEVWETTKHDEGKDEEKEEEKESGDVEMKDEEKAEASAEASEDETSSDGEDDEEEEEDLEELEDMEKGEDEDEEEKEDDRNDSTIFLRNLPFTCDDESLYEHFKQFGPLRYARIVVDHETERPRGTGFVCFWKPEDAATCVREAPRNNNVPANAKDRNNSAMKHSVLQNESSDPTGRYTLDGRVLQVARAVNKREATRLEEEGISSRLVRDKDKRRLYLLSEGTIPSNSPLYKKLSPSEIKLREESYKQREGVIKKNPALHLSLCRLSVRNLPRHITSKDLKQLAREAVVGFATEVKKELRQPISKEENLRSADTMKELEQLRKTKQVGIVRQATIVYETREGTKVPEKAGGGRSRGYGFIEYYTHRHALMGLRWLNCHAVDVPVSAQTDGDKDKKKRLIVEFAIENAQVIKRRQELQEKKEKEKEEKEKKKAEKEQEEADKQGQKRKKEEEEDPAEENKLAKRNRIIAKKRMQRRSRK